MGKKRIIKKSGGGMNKELRDRSLNRLAKKKIVRGVLHILATYNNTLLTFTDPDGNVLVSSSSGALGFKGAKKGTPYAAAKVGELLADAADRMGVKDIDVVIKGIGQGRESSVRAFMSRGFVLNSIRDETPVPHNGPRPRKPRRV